MNIKDAILLDEPAFAAAVEYGLDQVVRMRAMKQAWRTLLIDLQKKHGAGAIRAIQDEVDRRQRELDLDAMRRITCELSHTRLEP